MIEYVIIVGGVLVMFAMQRGMLSSGPECEVSVDKQFGMNLVKNQLIQCPDGDVRFAGANRNKTGTWDILTTDGRTIRGVDERRNIKFGANPIATMAGRGMVLCNVMITTGDETSWMELFGHDTSREYMFDLYDKEKQRNTNIISMGFTPYDGGQYTRLFAEESKMTGLRLKNLGLSRGMADTTEVSLRDRRMDMDEDVNPYGGG